MSKESLKLLDELSALGIVNPYTYLEIKESATEEEIKIAYRNIVKKYENQLSGKNNQDYYLLQMFKCSRDALLDEKARSIIDEHLNNIRKENAIAIKPKNEERTNANSSKKTEIQIRKEIFLPEIMEEFSISNNDELSFADLQLIIKEYIKRSWEYRNIPETENQDSVNLRDKFFLLDKKGNLVFVSERTGVCYRYLTDYFSNHDLYSTNTIFNSMSDWNEYRYSPLDKDTKLVNCYSILPERLTYTPPKKSDIANAVELGNECLMQLKKTGYLKKTTPNQYIK